MKIEATAGEIRALLRLAGADEGAARGGASEAGLQVREAAARAVPQRLRERYETLLEVGRIPVVAAIERGSCSGCHVRLPTMVEYKARRSPAVHTCPRCQRMLYAPDLLGVDPWTGNRTVDPAAPRQRGDRPDALPPIPAAAERLDGAQRSTAPSTKRRRPPGAGP